MISSSLRLSIASPKSIFFIEIFSSLNNGLVDDDGGTGGKLETILTTGCCDLTTGNGEIVLVSSSTGSPDEEVGLDPDEDRDDEGLDDDDDDEDDSVVVVFSIRVEFEQDDSDESWFE